MKQKHCSLCKKYLKSADKREKHRLYGRIICLWCAGMWVHGCCFTKNKSN